MDDLVDNAADAIRHLGVHLEIEATLDPFPASFENFPAGLAIDGAVLHPRKLVRKWNVSEATQSEFTRYEPSYLYPALTFC